MDTRCQASYPLNSENASPPGTFKLYLSWANRALPPKMLTSAVMMAIVRMRLLFTSFSFVQFSGLDFLPDGERCALPESDPTGRRIYHDTIGTINARELQALVRRRHLPHPTPSTMRTSRSTAPFRSTSAAWYCGLWYVCTARATLSNSTNTVRCFSTPSKVLAAGPRDRKRPPPASIAGTARRRTLPVGPDPAPNDRT